VFGISDELNVATTIAIIIPLVLIVAAALVDCIRRRDLSIRAKVLWTALIVFTLYIGTAIYYIARPPRAPEGKRYGDTEARSSALLNDLTTLRADHTAGRVSDDTYLSRKRAMLGLDSGST
jgi:hypothetical protein